MESGMTAAALHPGYKLVASVCANALAPVGARLPVAAAGASERELVDRERNEVAGME
jgi:hypothetical protein